MQKGVKEAQSEVVNVVWAEEPSASMVIGELGAILERNATML